MKVPVFSKFFGQFAVVFATASGMEMASAAALKEGDIAPDFSAEASMNGKAFTFRLSDALKKGPVVVYFYPSAYTPGCNTQAKTFSTMIDKFAAAGASVIGVSLDNIERLNDFSKDPDSCAGKFAVASDKDGKIAQSYALKVQGGSPKDRDTRGNAIGHGFAERVTFVVGKDGKIASVIGGISPEQNVQRALSVIQGFKS